MEILFSNIILNNKKELEFLPKPGFEVLFPDNLVLSGGVREDFEHVNRIINEIDFLTLKPIIQFAYSINKSFFDNQYNITKQQKILYGLD